MILRKLVPPQYRARARELLRDLPFRVRDLPADLWQTLDHTQPALPPAALRLKVSANSSRNEFLRIGQSCAADLIAAYQQNRTHAAPGAWLDFGCGCARIARHLVAAPLIHSYTGADNDPVLTAWTSRHMPGHWHTTSDEPPLPFPDHSFDVIISVSVFTHLPESAQLRWLRELRRLLRAGGLLLASTLPPSHAAHLPAPYALDPALVEARGFAHVSSIGPFNHQSSFHSEAYLQSSWSAYFSLKEHIQLGLGSYQDLSVWAASTHN